MKKAVMVTLFWAACNSALAQQNWQGADDFEIVELEGACVVTAEYEAEGRSDTRFFLSHDAEGVKIALTSLDWSKPAGPVDVTIDFLPNGKSYEGSAAPLTLDSFYDGFVVAFGGDEVLDQFAAANSVRVMRGDVIVDHLNLSGSAATTATLRRCTAVALRKEAERQRERDRFSNIPRDPFAQ